MKKIEIECPKCNALLSVDVNREFLFCEYCGNKILVEDEVKRSEHTENINITKNININKTSRDITRERELDYKWEKEKIRAVLIMIAFLTVVLGGLFGFFKYKEYKAKKQAEYEKFLQHAIMMPFDSDNFYCDPHEEAIEALKEAGFTNIQAIQGSMDFWDKPFGMGNGDVIKICINGSKIRGGQMYDKDAEIIITYFTY